MALLNTIEEPVRAGVVAEALSLSNQKASALLNQMATEGIVTKTEGAKKVSLFALTEAVEE